jgi:hypothetical protein
MKPSADIPRLRVVATDQLHAHELADEQRARPLASALRRDRVLKNPPVVIPIEGTEGYVVLDGANRVAAFRRLESPHCLVQVVNPAEELVEVRTWNHVLLGIGIEQAKRLLALPELLEESAREFREPDSAQLQVQFADGRSIRLRETKPSLFERIEQLNQVVEAYRASTHFERTSNFRIESLNGLYEQVAALIIFPEFTPAEVVKAAAAEKHFPPGVTRFIVSPRALRLNYPLAMLDSNESLADKQQHLETWVRSRVRNRRVRFYAESTFLFDE